MGSGRRPGPAGAPSDVGRGGMAPARAGDAACGTWRVRAGEGRTRSVASAWARCALLGLGEAVRLGGPVRGRATERRAPLDLILRALLEVHEDLVGARRG